MATPSISKRDLQGLPDWISRELVEDTLRVWCPRYAEHGGLTVQQAIGILLVCGQYVDAVVELDDEQAVRGIGESVIS